MANSAYDAVSTAPPAELGEMELVHPKTFIGKYIWSQDAKVIAVQYAITATAIGLVALALSIICTPSGTVGAIVARNVLPTPGSDVATQMSPPSSSAKRLLIDSPRPVPPNWRVVEASACENGRNSRSR